MKSGRAANLIAVFLVIGWWAAALYFRNHQALLAWLPKWSLAIAVLSPVAWITLYTVQGWLGHGKWWRTDLGTNMVWMETVIVWTSGVILWAQFFNHGSLDTFTQAWCYLGGVIGSIIVINWRSVIWLRNYRIDPGAEVRRLRARCAELELMLAARDEPSGEPA